MMNEKVIAALEGKGFTDAAEADSLTRTRLARKYEIVEKIVRSGNSRVYESWHRCAGVTMVEFLEGWRWLCDDPMPDGKLTRELGCTPDVNTLITDEQREIWGTFTVADDVGMVRLERRYDHRGDFDAFATLDGRKWEHLCNNRARINVNDRV